MIGIVAAQGFFQLQAELLRRLQALAGNHRAGCIRGSVAAVSGQEVVLLTVRSWPRDDVEAAMERIVSTFEIVARS